LRILICIHPLINWKTLISTKKTIQSTFICLFLNFTVKFVYSFVRDQSIRISIVNLSRRVSNEQVTTRNLNLRTLNQIIILHFQYRVNRMCFRKH